MKVARQFIAWNTAKNDPSRSGRCDPDVEFAEGHGIKRHDCDLNHTVPYGTGPLCGVFQAINCLATITPSSTGQQTVGTCPHFQLHITPSFEDEDDDENDAPRTACRALGLAEAGERVGNQKLGAESGVYCTVFDTRLSCRSSLETIHRS